MKPTLYTLASIILLLGCNSDRPKKTDDSARIKNEVLVLGTIHSGHLKYESYNLDVLTTLIRKIDPDIILTEIPPDRFPAAMAEFKEKDTITEARVKRFPEYVDVIFPLTKTMDFEIIPTAGWTKEMSDARSQKLKEIKEDSTRSVEWTELTSASEKSDSLIKESGREHDPYWINSPEYDRLVEIELEVYNRLFNDELGLGGWDNINAAHYGHIAEALDKHTMKGKRILITYGAGHKGWFLRALEKRNDIELLTLEACAPPEKE